ncbi:MAG TPA: hypothetical protein VNJ01_11150 [Bacteriovoracaceae bacterium]|nr:hypothetical protein [Bacteriovoracaceae bacterium]
MKYLGIILIAILPAASLAKSVELPFNSGSIKLQPVKMKSTLTSNLAGLHEDFSFKSEEKSGLKKWQDGLRKSLASSLPMKR